jgi:16S rRNA (guanine527-N7)-methyltransferase
VNLYDKSAMEPAHISSLLAPFVRHPLTDTQLRQLAAYLDLLLKWNARTNLTAVRDPEQIVVRHFGESLFAAEHLFATEAAQSVIDLGSGAGFPGIPIAIYAPDAQVTLIESQNKKATFLKEVARRLPLKNVAVFPGRGEAYPNKAAVVTMRAVEKFDTALTTAAGLVSPHGRLALLIGADQAVAAAMSSGELHWADPLPIPQSERRVLLVGRATPNLRS